MGEAVHTLSIIIPAYNEEKTIAKLLQRVLDADLGTGIERELIVVNDCSTDSTEQIVEDFIARHADAPIVYLKHERNYGKGMAVRTGIRAVTGDYIVMQDADLELDPNDFKKMLPFLLSGEYHVVYGSRFLAEENSHTYFSYQLGGKFLSVMTNILYRQRRFAEIDSSRLRGIRILSRSDGKSFETGLQNQRSAHSLLSPLYRRGEKTASERRFESDRHAFEISFLENTRIMKNSTTSKKNTPSTKKGTATPQKEGISFSWVAKNIFAVVIVLFLLNKFVLDVQPGYNWAYNMLQKNLETIRHYSRTTTDNRFEMKLGLSHVYLRYVKENTPENAVILLPGKEAFYPEGEERIFSGEPYNKLWAIRFLYPRRVIIPSELGKTPWSEKITHVAIVNGRGYEYLDYEVEQKAPHAVLPMHLKP